MDIKILGSGCAKCNALETATKQALTLLGIVESVKHISDPSEIASYGVMSTPALVVDNTVLSSGKALKVKAVKKLLAEYLDAK